MVHMAAVIHVRVVHVAAIAFRMGKGKVSTFPTRGARTRTRTHGVEA